MTLFSVPVIRAKHPPEQLTKPRDAVQAFERVLSYRDAAEAALSKIYNGHMTANSAAAIVLNAKAVAYRAVASEWERVLNNWLVARAVG